MSRLLAVLANIPGELGPRALAVYDDALVLVPWEVGAALAEEAVPPGLLFDPAGLAAGGPGRMLIRLSDIAAARLSKPMLGLGRELALDLRSGSRLVLRWPSRAPGNRDRLVMSALREALGDRLGSS